MQELTFQFLEHGMSWAAGGGTSIGIFSGQSTSHFVFVGLLAKALKQGGVGVVRAPGVGPPVGSPIPGLAFWWSEHQSLLCWGGAGGLQELDFQFLEHGMPRCVGGDSSVGIFSGQSTSRFVLLDCW